jgi:hypothetical protein
MKKELCGSDTPPEYDEDYQLCGYDIFSIIGYSVGIALESDIESVNWIKDRMDNNAVIILLNDRETVKHWACIVKDNESYCFFDSLGDRPTNPYLVSLIDRYMNKALQHYNTNTCGRWVGHFIRFYCINEDSYAALFKGCKDPDGYITQVTGDLVRFTRSAIRQTEGVLGIWDAKQTRRC